MDPETPASPDERSEDRPELYRPDDHYTRGHDPLDPGVDDAPQVRGAPRPGHEGHPRQPHEPPGGPAE